MAEDFIFSLEQLWMDRFEIVSAFEWWLNFFVAYLQHLQTVRVMPNSRIPNLGRVSAVRACNPKHFHIWAGQYLGFEYSNPYSENLFQKKSFSFFSKNVFLTNKFQFWVGKIGFPKKKIDPPYLTFIDYCLLPAPID